MDDRTGRGEEDEKKECPRNKADQLGLSEEHKMGAVCWRVEVLDCQAEFGLGGSGKPLATFDHSRDALGRVTR